MAKVEKIEYGGKEWRRYPESKRRTLRVYYQRHEKWKEPPVFLHRKIYEDNFGPIPEGFHIHHIDGNPDNNSPDNLAALPASAHGKITAEENNAPEKRAKIYARRQTDEWRKKQSESQKKRKQIEAVCQLCGEKFLTRSHSGNIKWCSECKKMQYSDKNGLHFSKKKQVERFGRVIVPY